MKILKAKGFAQKIEPLQWSAMILAATLVVSLAFLTFSAPVAKGVASDEIAWATDITAGGSHSCAIYNLGTPYCWGSNDDGQLGTGNTTNRARPFPVDISGLAAGLVFKQISAGFFHTCAVVGLSGSDASNSVYCWGKNDRGQLGLGVANSTLVLSPTAVANPGGLVAKKVSSGFAHTCAIYGDSGSDSNDRAYCWGNNDEGQLGDGSGVYNSGSQTWTTLPTSRFAPYAVTSLTAVNDISAGAMSSCASAASGLYCWGGGGSGQLGNGANDSSSTPVAALVSSVDVATGWFYACGALSNYSNDMMCWGDNTSGQLGTGDNTSSTGGVAVTGLGGLNNKQIAAGYAHTCTIAGGAGDNSNDTLFCWGENADGQILNGSSGTNTNAPAAVNLANVPSGYVPKKVAAGWAHTMVVYGLPDSYTSDMIFGCGDNSDGQVGDNTMNSCDALVPIDTTDVEGIDISLELDVSSVQFSVTPSSAGESGRNVATVTTKMPTGYSLAMQANGSNLVCSSGAATGQTIPSLTADGVLPAGESRWGWNLGTFTSGSWQEPATWRTIPFASPVLVAQTSSASASDGDDYGIFFGARVNALTKPCDSYDQTLTLTATMKL